MDYFDVVFHTFLGFDSGIYFAVNVTQASRFSYQTILNRVPKTKEAFTGLDRHGVSD